MNKSLSTDEIKKLLRGSGRPEPWFNEAEIRKLATAVKNEEDEVTIGKLTFSINYSDTQQAVFIKPIPYHGMYVPCGWFNYDTLRQALKREPKV
jgi:hypothetical protein